MLSFSAFAVLFLSNWPSLHGFQPQLSLPRYRLSRDASVRGDAVFSMAPNNILESKKDAGITGVTDSDEDKRPHLVFPGGGIFFYWVAGVVTYLREQGYDISPSAVTSTGASAGALIATLTATGVDFYKATDLALKMSADAGVWDRKEGLQGIWGPIIYNWLDELLPEDAVEIVHGGPTSSERRSLSILVTPLPNIFGPKDSISTFFSRQDLIECNMASAHLPWFLDGKLTSKFRGKPHIDGSFFASVEDFLIGPHYEDLTIHFDYTRDPLYKNKNWGDIGKALSADGIWNMLEDGKRYAKVMEERGEFSLLTKRN